MPNAASPTRLIPIAVCLFALGLVCVLIVLGLFAAGQSDLPWWLNVAAIGLTSGGFAIGLFALVREALRR